jgi:hypothetical protein
VEQRSGIGERDRLHGMDTEARGIRALLCVILDEEKNVRFACSIGNKYGPKNERAQMTHGAG